MLQVQEQISLLPDSIPSKKEEIEMLKSLPVDELIEKLVNSLATFAINLTIAILVFIVGRFLIRKINKILSSILTKRNVDPSLSTFVLSLVKMVLYFILVVTVIGIIGIETSSFLALFASAGVALGMALSGTLQNFAGGVLILLLKPYRIGDYIEAQGFAGIVKEIQIFNTIIVTVDNKSIIIPNGGLSTSSINNYSRETFRRVDWTVSISYGDSVDDARKCILEILNSDDRIMDHSDITKIKENSNSPVAAINTGREPVVHLGALADSSVNLTIRAWVKNEDYWSVFFSMNERFYNELPKHGVHFPFPQLDVHVNQ